MQYVGFRLKPGSSKISHNSKFYNSKAVLHAHQKVPGIYKWTSYYLHDKFILLIISRNLFLKVIGTYLNMEKEPNIILNVHAMAVFPLHRVNNTNIYLQAVFRAQLISVRDKQGSRTYKSSSTNAAASCPPNADASSNVINRPRRRHAASLGRFAFGGVVVAFVARRCVLLTVDDAARLGGHRVLPPPPTLLRDSRAIV